MGGTVVEAPASQRGESNLLRLEGSVDVRVARRLHGTMRERARDPADLVVDCSAVERLDASAVQLLLSLKAALAATGNTLVLRSIPAPVLSFLSITGAAAALEVDPLAQLPTSEERPEPPNLEPIDPHVASPAVDTVPDPAEEAATAVGAPVTEDGDVDVDSLFARGRRDH